LTIVGISSDDWDKDCQVFADANDLTPMRNVTATGDSGKESDFSKWSFTYKEDYHLIEEGENELTAKIACFGTTDAHGGPQSEWHTVNVTAIPATTSEMVVPEVVIVPVTPSVSPLSAEERNIIRDGTSDDDNDDGDAEDTDSDDDDNGNVED
jgi:hypothetical protein